MKIVGKLLVSLFAGILLFVPPEGTAAGVLMLVATWTPHLMHK